MSLLADAWPWLIAMGVLIFLSALFSGSEAALFSLSQRDRRRLSRGGVGGRVATGLLQNPESLLSAILFWNLLINMTYFGIAAIIGGRLEASPDASRSMAIAFTIISLLAIIFFSEMLPKSVAVLTPVRVSIILGPPLSLAIKLVSPILPLVRVSNLAASRLIWPSFKPEPEIELGDIERAIELSTDDAALLQRERAALQSLVELAEVRVAELMRPRSKLCLAPPNPTRAVLASGPPPGGFIMVTDETGEQIVEAIGVRTLRPSQIDDFENTAEPVLYVPWSALLSQVLDRLNDEGRSVAVVVNEFGEAVGAVTSDDILRKVLAPRRSDDEGENEIQQIDEEHFRVAGSVSLRALAKRLGTDVPDEAIITVGGYLQKQNERLPRLGDTATIDRFTLEVVDEEDNRIWIQIRPIERDEESP